MKLKDAIEWAHRAEPAEIFIAGHPRHTQDALWLLVNEVERLSVENKAVKSGLDITCLKVQIKDQSNSYQEKVRENEELRATLKEVSGCYDKHNTPKLCGGCLVSIAGALAE